MSSWKKAFLRPGFLCLIACQSMLAAACVAQATPTAASSALHSGVDGDELPPVLGFNVSLAAQGVHSSAVGWNASLTPDLSYRVNSHLSFDALVGWYPLVSAYIQPAKSANASTLRTTHNVFADTVLGGHVDAGHGNFSYTGTAILGLPTGNVRYGLGANQVTYNVTNDLGYTLGPFTPELEIGEGNNSSFANRGVHKAYVAVGPIANFQAGTAVDLPVGASLDLRAYEDLPIGNQNVYGTVTRKGRKGTPVTQQLLQGSGAVEDNGLNAELDLPMGVHCLLVGNYERSIIQGLDTATVGLTWTLRAPKQN